MITETQLFSLGWKRFGDDENDLYYKIFLKRTVFGLDYLSGNFTENNDFIIYSMHNRVFTDISQIVELFFICRFEINWDLMNRYGSNVPLNSKIFTDEYLQEKFKELIYDFGEINWGIIKDESWNNLINNNQSFTETQLNDLRVFVKGLIENK